VGNFTVELLSDVVQRDIELRFVGLTTRRIRLNQPVTLFFDTLPIETQFPTRFEFFVIRPKNPETRPIGA
jgi:hypothetical protein